ncbi:MAG: bifunctional homocysteine S-methyltransferase/methylenetetrahydrofolate reductase [Chloroflexota bacterium]|nr:bifunctional homocysteine S-methyltransferase/methylenetetrahydrofolate reductase [Chloroflexota bacterium]
MPQNAHQTFKQAIEKKPLLCDGAMGTLLHSFGYSLERCLDETNHLQPNLVLRAHSEYLSAGADVIETNTFGANRAKLEEYDLAEQVTAINEAGVRLAKQAVALSGRHAYVAGAVGPLGKGLAPFGPISSKTARSVYGEQIGVLAEGGVDLLLLETFSDLDEITVAVEMAHQVAPGIPIVALMTFVEARRTMAGHSPEDVANALCDLGVTLSGANCSAGPALVLRVARRMQLACPRLNYAAQPNAGYPTRQSGRLLYPSSPAYFADFAQQAAAAGMQFIGGCCGTTPAHTAAMAEALRRPPLDPAVLPVLPPVRELELGEPPLPTQLEGMLGKEFIITVEMHPPRGIDSTQMLADSGRLKEAGANILNVADSPLARMRMSPWACAYLIQEQLGLETILHFPTRGRNLLRVQGDLLAAHALGVRNLFVVMGDPTHIGDYPDASDSYDVVPSGLIRLISHNLNQGRDQAGNPIGQPTGFVAGCALNLGAPKMARELRVLGKKLDGGARFALTQPVFDIQLLRDFVAVFGKQPPLPLIMGLLPLYTARHARFLHHEVPGMSIPPEILSRMETADEQGRSREEGIRIARELLLAARPMIQGVYLMPPFRRYDIAAEVMGALR